MTARRKIRSNLFYSFTSFKEFAVAESFMSELSEVPCFYTLWLGDNSARIILSPSERGSTPKGKNLIFSLCEQILSF